MRTNRAKKRCETHQRFTTVIGSGWYFLTRQRKSQSTHGRERERKRKRRKKKKRRNVRRTERKNDKERKA